MIKRASISLNPVQFRISKPGVDVDVATPDQLLLDERVFYTQLYVSGQVVNNAPAANHTQSVAFPALGIVPICMVWPIYADNVARYPSFYKYQTGGTAFYYPAVSFSSRLDGIDINFGAYDGVSSVVFLVFRRAY